VKKIIWALLITTLSILLTFPGKLLASTLDEGFRGVKWETTISEMTTKGFEPTRAMFGKSCVKNPKDNLSLGSNPLNSIIYCGGISGKFKTVEITAESVQFDGLKEFLTKSLGKEGNNFSNKYGKKFIWRTEKATIMIWRGLYDYEGSNIEIKYTPPKAPQSGGGL